MLDTWIEIPENSDFTIYNIPFGIFRTHETTARAGIAIGNEILDLVKAHELGIFNDFSLDRNVFRSNFLNNFISLGKETTSRVRLCVQSELCNKNSILRKKQRSFFKTRRSANATANIDWGLHRLLF